MSVCFICPHFFSTYIIIIFKFGIKLTYIFFFNDEKKQHQLLTQNRKYSNIDMLVMNEEWAKIIKWKIINIFFKLQALKSVLKMDHKL